MISSSLRFSFKTLLLAGIASSYIGLAHAQEKSFNDAQKEEIQSIVKDYLLENPEIMTEVMVALRTKQEAAEQKQAEEKLAEYKDYFKSDDLAYAGNKDGDVIVVEFFDYNCGYCKKAFPDVQALLEEDKNVKVVFMEMPILGPTSLTAAKWAEAAKDQGKYFEFHSALMKFQGNKDEKSLRKIARDLGLDVEQMAERAESQDIQDRINKSMEISQDMGIRGTPAFIVGDQIFRGYIGEEALIQSVKDSRS